MVLCLFPLPSFVKLLCQFSSRYRMQPGIHFNSFVFLPWKKKRYTCGHFILQMPSNESVLSSAFTTLTMIPVFASQRCQSCRWQLTSPDSRWRRSSAWMNTGASAWPGAPPEPRRAKKRTSELLVSAVKMIHCVIQMHPTVTGFSSYCVLVCYKGILIWWLFSLKVGGEGLTLV